MASTSKISDSLANKIAQNKAKIAKKRMKATKTGDTYTKKHTQKKAFESHLRKIKDRFGKVSTRGLTITYSFTK